MPSPYLEKHNVDSVPTLELGKKSYGCEIDYEASAKRKERAKRREKHAIEQQELEAAEKRQKLNESSFPVAQIDFNQPSTSTEEEKLETKMPFLMILHAMKAVSLMKSEQKLWEIPSAKQEWNVKPPN